MDCDADGVDRDVPAGLGVGVLDCRDCSAVLGTLVDSVCPGSLGCDVVVGVLSFLSCLSFALTDGDCGVDLSGLPPSPCWAGDSAGVVNSSSSSSSSCSCSD